MNQKGVQIPGVCKKPIIFHTVAVSHITAELLFLYINKMRRVVEGLHHNADGRWDGNIMAQLNENS